MELLLFILDQIQTGKEPSCPNKTGTCVLARVSFIKALLTDSVKDRIVKKTKPHLLNLTAVLSHIQCPWLIYFAVPCGPLKNVKYICKI